MSKAEEYVRAIIAKCADDLLGTQQEIHQWLDSKGMPEDMHDDVEAGLADHIERCPDCDTWCEPGELVNDDNEPCSCEQCRN